MGSVILAVVLSGVSLGETELLGQGQFLFDANDVPAGNYVRFIINGDFARGPDLFVQVFAGRDPASMVPLEPLLALNETGALAGLPNPSKQVYEVPGFSEGTEATVGYVGFKGASLSTATVRGLMNFANAPVTLTEPPAGAKEVSLGGGTLFRLISPNLAR